MRLGVGDRAVARGVTTFAVFALMACAFAAPAGAVNLPNAELASKRQVLTWSGRNADLTEQGFGAPTEQSCTETTCDSFLLKLNFPAGTFPKAPLKPIVAGTERIYPEGPTDMPGDGVLITIRWPTDFDQWNLYVDDTSTGETVAKAIDVDSNAQSVLLSQPHNGTYKVTIVPFYTDFQKADIAYQGSASAFLDPTQRYKTVKELLPKIATTAPSNFHIGDVPPTVSNPTGWRYTPDGTFANSCYLDETAEFGSTRCLRFDNDIHNIGAGPLILRFDYTPEDFSGNCEMSQEVISSNATAFDRPAGPCEFHKQHGHFHYKNMAIYQLYPVGAGGMPGKAPVATSHKVGFCTIDVDNYTFGQPAKHQRPRTYSFPTCNIPNAYSSELASGSPYVPSGLPEYMGISPGWGDIYTWDLPQQYIDISSVPDGTYEVVSRSNPDGALLMSGRNKETGITCVHIAGTSVETLRTYPAQSNKAPLPTC
jgi:hypothetical protein